MGLLDRLTERKYRLEEDLFPGRAGDIPPLDDAALRLAFRIARDAVSARAAGAGQPAPEGPLPEVFSRDATVDAACWIGGALRGSQIVSHKPLGEAIALAAFRAAADPRFDPVAPDELGTMRLEIALMSQRMRRLSSEERSRPYPDDPRRGYRAMHGRHTGWYVPAVFNCVRFPDMGALVKSLAVSKAGLPERHAEDALVESFMTAGFVESMDHSAILPLRGAVVARGYAFDTDEDLRRWVQTMVRKAADHLCLLVREDGDIPAVLEVLAGRDARRDPVRAMCAAEALAFAGERLGEPRYAGIAGRMAAHEEAHPAEDPSVRLAADTYRAKTRHILGDKEVAREAAARIRAELSSGILCGPIASLQAASLFSLFDDEAASGEAARLLAGALGRFGSEGRKMQLASFPEAIPVALRLAGRHPELLSGAEKLARWLVSCQLPDGSFPIVAGSAFAYARGTGKVLEALAAFPERRYEEPVRRAAAWLADMQYDEENAYFIREDFRSSVIGGFRHDAFDPDAWIDASAHAIVAGLRIMDRPAGT